MASLLKLARMLPVAFCLVVAALLCHAGRDGWGAFLAVALVYGFVLSLLAD
jgi:hypothetical protein